MIQDIIIISLVCNGLFIAMEPGMVLGFIKDPFRSIPDKLETAKIDYLNAQAFNELKNDMKRPYMRLKFAKWLLSPIMLCIGCMSSVWGTIIYYLLHGTFGINWIITITACVFVNSLLYSLYVRL